MIERGRENPADYVPINIWPHTVLALLSLIWRDSMSVASCSKCGGGDISTRYHQGESYWGDSRHCAYGEAARPGTHRKGEHLHLTCRTCGFDWTKECANVAA